MTKLRKPVRRETGATIYERCKHRPVVVTLEPPSIIAFRLKGTRRTFRLTVDGCYTMAVKAAVEGERQARRKTQPRRSVSRGLVRVWPGTA